MATQHLLDQGHRKIGCISGPLCRTNSFARKQGYLDTMQRAGVIVMDAWCAEGNYGRTSGYDAAKQLFENNSDLTALFSCSEEMTVGALQYFHEAGIHVPDQVSIVSFDSIERCEDLYPTVTAVHFPVSEMARAAALLLNSYILGKPIESDFDFEPHLIIRNADRAI